MGNLTEPVAISLRHWAEGAEPVAAWWSQEGPGGAGGWSSEGCQLRSSHPNVSSLHCQHLGNVAVLMVSVVALGGEMDAGGRGQVLWSPEDSGKCPSDLPHTSHLSGDREGLLRLLK